MGQSYKQLVCPANEYLRTNAASARLPMDDSTCRRLLRDRPLWQLRYANLRITGVRPCP
jgi:hypothetical protein